MYIINYIDLGGHCNNRSAAPLKSRWEQKLTRTTNRSAIANRTALAVTCGRATPLVLCVAPILERNAVLQFWFTKEKAEPFVKILAP